MASLTPQLVEHLLRHMSQQRLLRPRTLEFFFGCPLQKFVLNFYPYCTNELLRQLRAFATLKHLSLVNSPLITGTAELSSRSCSSSVVEWFVLDGASVLCSDSGLSVLSSLVKLQHLNLAFCSKLTDSCLQYIAGQTGVTLTKRFSVCLATTTFRRHLLLLPPTSPSLLRLCLLFFPPPTRLVPLRPSFPGAGLKQLCFLSLDQTKVTDAGMVAYLQSAPSCLSQLSLNQTAVTEATLAVLPQAVPQLRLLNIKQTKVAGGAVSRVSSRTAVRALTLWSLPGVGRVGAGSPLQAADSQSGRDTGDGKFPGAAGDAPDSVLPQPGGDPSGQRRRGSLHRLRCGTQSVGLGGKI